MMEAIAMEVENSTGQNTDYRAIPKGLMAAREAPLLGETLYSGTLAAHAHVELELPPTGPWVVQFLRDGKVIAQCEIDSPAAVIMLLPDSLGGIKPRVIRRRSNSIEPSEAAVRQGQRNAEARASLLQEFGAFTSTQIADHERWKQEERIFSVRHQESTLYPAFQFDRSGQPYPVIARVIQALGYLGSEWALALWFISSNGWLSGRRPVDLLEQNPEAVAEAATRDAAELVF